MQNQAPVTVVINFSPFRYNLRNRITYFYMCILRANSLGVFIGMCFCAGIGLKVFGFYLTWKAFFKVLLKK